MTRLEGVGGYVSGLQSRIFFRNSFSSFCQTLLPDQSQKKDKISRNPDKEKRTVRLKWFVGVCG